MPKEKDKATGSREESAEFRVNTARKTFANKQEVQRESNPKELPAFSRAEKGEWREKVRAFATGNERFTLAS